MQSLQTIANKYRLGEIIYTSDLTWVYEASFLASSREAKQIPLIVKTIPRVRLDDGKAQNLKGRVRSEEQALASLDNPFIVKVIDEIEAAGIPYLVMRRRNMNLNDYLQTKGKLKLVTAIPLLYNLATALDYAHSQGILHRDIKPDNILLDLDAAGQALYPYITDFGIAQFQERGFRTETNHIMGTMAYMPPERWEGKETTNLSDIYSFGLVAYEMLAGSPLFKSGEVIPVQEQINSILNPSTEFLQGIKARLDPDVAGIILKAIARKPEDRFQSATSFIDQLGKLLSASQLEIVNQAIARNEALAGRADEAALRVAKKQQKKFPILWLSVAALSFFVIGMMWAQLKPPDSPAASPTIAVVEESSATQPSRPVEETAETSEVLAMAATATNSAEPSVTSSPTKEATITVSPTNTASITPSPSLSPTFTYTPSITPSPIPEVNCEGAGWVYHQVNRNDSLSHYSFSLAPIAAFAGLDYQARIAYIVRVNAELDFSRLAVGDLVCLPAIPPMYLVAATATVLSTGGAVDAVNNTGSSETASGTSNDGGSSSGGASGGGSSGGGSSSGGAEPTSVPAPPPTAIPINVSVSASCGNGNSGSTSFRVSNNGGSAVSISWRVMEGGSQVGSGSLSLGAGESATAWSGNTKNKNYSLTVNETGASSGESCG